MKAAYYSLISMSILMCSIVTIAWAAPVSPRDAVLAGCNKQNRAAENKDVASYMSTLAPDFVSRTRDGEISDRAQAKKTMMALFAATNHLNGQTTIQSFTVKAGKAYITTKEHDTLILTDPQTHQPITMVIDEIDSAVWRNIGGIWKEESEREISENHSTQLGPQPDNAPGQAA